MHVNHLDESLMSRAASVACDSCIDSHLSRPQYSFSFLHFLLHCFSYSVKMYQQNQQGEQHQQLDGSECTAPCTQIHSNVTTSNDVTIVQ